MSSARVSDVTCRCRPAIRTPAARISAIAESRSPLSAWKPKRSPADPLAVWSGASRFTSQLTRNPTESTRLPAAARSATHRSSRRESRLTIAPASKACVSSSGVLTGPLTITSAGSCPTRRASCHSSSETTSAGTPLRPIHATSHGSEFVFTEYDRTAPGQPRSRASRNESTCRVSRLSSTTNAGVSILSSIAVSSSGISFCDDPTGEALLRTLSRGRPTRMGTPGRFPVVRVAYRHMPFRRCSHGYREAILGLDCNPEPSD